MFPGSIWLSLLSRWQWLSDADISVSDLSLSERIMAYIRMFFKLPPRGGANEVCEANRSELRFNHKPKKKWLKYQKNDLPLMCHLRKEMGNAGMRPISANRVGTINRRCLGGSGCSPLLFQIGVRCAHALSGVFVSPQPPKMGEIGFFEPFERCQVLPVLPVFSVCF